MTIIAEILIKQSDPVMLFASVMVAVFEITRAGGEVVGYRIRGKFYFCR